MGTDCADNPRSRHLQLDQMLAQFLATAWAQQSQGQIRPSTPFLQNGIQALTRTHGVEGLAKHRCLIRSITHPELGAIQSIDTNGLDYRISLALGDVVVLDAEEDAGTIAGGGRADLDWSFLVEIDAAAQLHDADRRRDASRRG